MTAATSCRNYGPRLVTLRKRHEFLRLRGGARWSGKGFVLEGKRRAVAVRSEMPGSELPGSELPGSGIPGLGIPGLRIGFTISKKVGLAHERNRMRRRLSHALRLVRDTASLAEWDCVVIARRPSLDMPFEALLRDFKSALERLASSRAMTDERPRRRGKTSPGSGPAAEP